MSSQSVAHRPKAPRVDKSEEIEGFVRQMFVTQVREWMDENLDDDNRPEKDVLGTIIDNLTACFTASIETQIEGAVTLYMSTVDDSDDEDEDESGEGEPERD